MHPPVEARTPPPSTVGALTWLPTVTKQLRAIEQLTPGWDSNGADPPNPRILRAAHTLIVCLCEAGLIAKPHVNPTRNGGVQLEWESPLRYFELDVDCEQSAAYFFQDEIEGAEVEGRVSVGERLEPILEFVRRVTLND